MSERDNLRLYCRQCTDAQLRNVYEDEIKRAENHPDTDTGRVAELFADEAEREMERRGMTPQ